MGPKVARLVQLVLARGSQHSIPPCPLPDPFPTTEVYGVLFSMDCRKNSLRDFVGAAGYNPLSSRRGRPFRRQDDIANAASAKPPKKNRIGNRP